MKRNAKTILCIFLAFSCLIYAGRVGRAASLTNDSIRQKEQDIKKAQEEKAILQQGLSDVKQLVAELEQLKDNLAAYVTQLDEQLNTIQTKIEELQALINTKEAEIDETSGKLEAAVAREEEQYAAMKKRIQFMYEHGKTFYFEIILSADSFGDVLNKAEYVEQLSKYDRQQFLDYQETRRQVEEYKALLEEQRATLAEAQMVLKGEQETVQTLIAAKEREIRAYESDINNKSITLKEYEEEIAAQNAQIAELERQVAEEKKRLAASNRKTIVYDGGEFKWPAPACTKITDEYGNRLHPILQVEQFHNGVDMAAPGGSPILAAYDGEVIAAAYSSSMGNYIMIDHGNELYTIYMHASALYVSKGEIVVKGQKIAAVGSTGRSTGNHLHFSVRLNGSYTSPWNYLSP